MAFCTAAAISFGRAWWQDHLLRRQTSRETLAALTWRQFEQMLAALFRREGFSVKVTGDSAADGGVDLVLRHNDEVILVQAKHWRRDVTVNIVRELYGVMTAESAARGIVVTSGRFTADAKAFAATLPIELLDGDALVSRIRAAQVTPTGAVPAERACPTCHSPMVLRVARKGPNPGAEFYGCSKFPTCHTTLPLGA